MTEARAMRDFALEAYMSKWEFVARYNLTGSDAESLRLPDLLALANDGERAEFENLSLSYTQTYGAPALRADAMVSAFEGLRRQRSVPPEPVVALDPKLKPGAYQVQLVVVGPTGKSAVASLLIKVVKE